MISHVLTPFDATEETRRAAEIAGGLAATVGADLRVLAYANKPGVPATSPALDDYIDVMRSRYRLEPTVISIAKYRFISDELISDARRHTRSVIVMPADNRGRRSLFHLSSAVDALTYSDAPVLLVGPKCERFLFDHGGPMLVAVDGTGDSERILQAAHEWSGALDLPIEVVNVLDPAPPAELAGVLASGDVHEAGYVSTVVRDTALRGDDATFSVRHGEPAKEIVDVAVECDAAVIAMASSVPLGLDRLLHGSVLDDVTQAAPVPVLALNQHPFLG